MSSLNDSNDIYSGGYNTGEVTRGLSGNTKNLTTLDNFLI